MYLGFNTKNKARFMADLTAEMRKLIGPQEMRRVGVFVRDRIIDRTQKGKDVKGRAFKRYGTKRLYVPLKSRPKPKGGQPTFKGKAKKGKTRRYDGGYAEYHSAVVKRPPGSIVSLSLTGDMMGNIHVRSVGKKAVRLSIPNSRENAKAYGHDKGKGKGRVRREWFNYGISRNEQAELAYKIESLAMAKAKKGKR